MSTCSPRFLLAAILLVAVVLLGPAPGRSARADDGEGEAAEGLVTQVFDVTALTAGRRSFIRMHGPVALPDDEDFPIFGSEGEEPLYPFGAPDDLSEQIRQRIRPETWDATLGATCRWFGHLQLVVRAYPDVVAEVGAYLAELARQVGRCAFVDVASVRGDPVEMVRLAGPDGDALPEERIEALLAGERAGPAISFLALEGTQTAVFQGRQHAFLQDYDVMVAEQSTGSDPIVTVANLGLCLAVEVRLAGDGRDAHVDLHGYVADLVEEREIDVGLHRWIECPVISVTHVDAHHVVTAGRWTRLNRAAADEDDDGWTLLVRVRPLPLADPAEAAAGVPLASPPERASRTFERRTFDVGLLSRTIWQAMGPSINLVPSNFTPPEPPELNEPVPLFPEDSLVEFVQETIAPASWQLQGTYISGSDGRIDARNAPEILDAVGRHIEALRAGFVFSIESVTEVVDVPRDLAARLGDAAGRALAGEAQAALAAALEDGSAVRRGTSRVTARNGARNVASAGREVHYLQDFWIETAKGASIANPIVQRILSGTLLDVDARRTPGRGAAETVLRFSRTHVHHPIRTQVTPHGPIELPEMDLVRWHGNVAAPLGRTIVAATWGAGERRSVLLVTQRVVENGP